MAIAPLNEPVTSSIFAAGTTAGEAADASSFADAGSFNGVMLAAAGLDGMVGAASEGLAALGPDLTDGRGGIAPAAREAILAARSALSAAAAAEADGLPADPAMVKALREQLAGATGAVRAAVQQDFVAYELVGVAKDANALQRGAAWITNNLFGFINGVATTPQRIANATEDAARASLKFLGSDADGDGQGRLVEGALGAGQGLVDAASSFGADPAGTIEAWRKNVWQAGSGAAEWIAGAVSSLEGVDAGALLGRARDAAKSYVETRQIELGTAGAVGSFVADGILLAEDLRGLYNVARGLGGAIRSGLDALPTRPLGAADLREALWSAPLDEVAAGVARVSDEDLAAGLRAHPKIGQVLELRLSEDGADAAARAQLSRVEAALAGGPGDAAQRAQTLPRPEGQGDITSQAQPYNIVNALDDIDESEVSYVLDAVNDGSYAALQALDAEARDDYRLVLEVARARGMLPARTLEINMALSTLDRLSGGSSLPGTSPTYSNVLEGGAVTERRVRMVLAYANTAPTSDIVELGADTIARDRQTLRTALDRGLLPERRSEIESGLARLDEAAETTALSAATMAPNAADTLAALASGEATPQTVEQTVELLRGILVSDLARFPQALKDDAYLFLRNARSADPDLDTQELANQTYRLMRAGASFPDPATMGTITISDVGDLATRPMQEITGTVAQMSDAQLDALPTRLLSRLHALGGGVRYAIETSPNPVQAEQLARLENMLLERSPIQADIQNMLGEFPNTQSQLRIVDMRTNLNTGFMTLFDPEQLRQLSGAAAATFGDLPVPPEQVESNPSIVKRTDVTIGYMTMMEEPYMISNTSDFPDYQADRDARYRLPGEDEWRTVPYHESVFVPPGTEVKVGLPGDRTFSRFTLPEP